MPEESTDAGTSLMPVESRQPVTVGRIVHVYAVKGWKPKYEHHGGMRHEPKAGMVVAGFGKRANIRVMLDVANDHSDQPDLCDGQAMSCMVYEAMSDQQREAHRQRTSGLWAEWPPRV